MPPVLILIDSKNNATIKLTEIATIELTNDNLQANLNSFFSVGTVHS